MVLRRRNKLPDVYNTRDKQLNQLIDYKKITIPMFVGKTTHTTYTLSGQILDENGEGLKGFVKFIDKNMEIYDTDSNGSFSISNIIKGVYNIIFSADSHLDKKMAITINTDITDYTVSLEKLTESYSFGGYVIDKDKRTSVTGILVELLKDEKIIQSVYSESNKFVLDNIPNGDYTIRISNPNYTDYTDNITINSNSYNNQFLMDSTTNFMSEADLNEETNLLNSLLKDTDSETIVSQVKESLNNVNVSTDTYINVKKYTNLASVKADIYTEGDTDTSNPLYFVIKNYFEEVTAPKTDFETENGDTSETIPYIYVVDLGNVSDINNALIRAYEEYSTYEDCELFVPCGLSYHDLCGNVKGENTDLMNTILTLLELVNTDWENKKFGSIFTSFIDQPVNECENVEREKRYFDFNLDVVKDYKYLGQCVGRYCLTPYDTDIGRFPFRSLTNDDIKETKRSRTEHLNIKNNGFIEVQTAGRSSGEYPFIVKGVSKAYGLGDLAPDLADTKVRRLVNQIVRDVDDAVFSFRLANETEYELSLLQTNGMRVVTSYINDELLKDGSSFNVYLSDKTDTDIIGALDLIVSGCMEVITINVSASLESTEGVYTLH